MKYIGKELYKIKKNYKLVENEVIKLKKEEKNLIHRIKNDENKLKALSKDEVQVAEPAKDTIQVELLKLKKLYETGLLPKNLYDNKINELLKTMSK